MFYNIFYERIRYLQSFLITIVQTANSKLSHTHFEIEAARDGITHIVLNTAMTRKDSGNQSDIETKVHDIPILYQVLLSLYAHLSCLFHCTLRSIPDIILILDHFSSDKTLFEVGMNHTGALGCFPSFMEGPRTHLLHTGSEECL